jgi:NAD(P)-dependent dehydrogenase (short-subunit alcohol dehydrogenase family)
LAWLEWPRQRRPGRGLRRPPIRPRAKTIFEEEAGSDRYQGVLGGVSDPIASPDTIKDARGSIVDLTMPQVVDGDLVKIMSWYDNEWRYAAQMAREGPRRSHDDPRLARSPVDQGRDGSAEQVSRRNAKMARLTGKVAIVTGGALGIGAAACEMMAREGATVAVTDVLADDGEATAARIVSTGGTARFWHMDVSDEAEVERVFGEVAGAGAFGKLDVVVNNAGIAGANKPTDEVAAEEWDKVISVNVRGVFFCTKHAVPHLRRAGGGSIINLSSIYGIIGAPDLPPYHASKGAVRLMTKTDALIYAKDKIRVNSVHPGYIWTPLVEALGRDSPQGLEAFRRELDSKHPIGHVGEPDDIAHGIVYLASDEAKFVTGSELVIDGGYTAA